MYESGNIVDRSCLRLQVNRRPSYDMNEKDLPLPLCVCGTISRSTERCPKNHSDEALPVASIEVVKPVVRVKEIVAQVIIMPVP